MPDHDISSYDLLIIGAGPAGLACAIAASKAGLRHCIIDQGAVADAIRRFPTDLVFFSTPELLEIGGVPFVTAGFRPTRVEAVRYYQRVAREYRLQIIPHKRVTTIERGESYFRVVTEKQVFRAENVVVATGYFDNPNPFSIPGSDLLKVKRYYDEPFQYVGQRVAVVGGKNSAVETALDLYRHGATVTLVHRGASFSEGVKYWILPDIENRAKSGEVRALFGTQVREIRDRSIVVEGSVNEEIPNDFVFVMIGYRPKVDLLKRAGVALESDSLAPVHNSESMETSVTGLYVAGSLAAGKYNNKIFIENGRLHGRLIVNAIQRK